MNLLLLPDLYKKYTIYLLNIAILFSIQFVDHSSY